MDESAMTAYIMHTFEGVETGENFGYTFFFYGAERVLPFATLVAADNEYEHISNLDRPGVYRLNIGVSRETVQSLFGTGKADLSAYDYTALDTLMPHPDYAAQNWLCVLAPAEATLETVRSLLAEAYDLVYRRQARQEK